MPTAVNGSIPYIVPVLLVAWALLAALRRSGRMGKRPLLWQAAVLVLSVPLALERTGGTSVAEIMLTASPGYSVSSIAALIVLVLSELRGKALFDRNDWNIFFGFILLTSALVFLSTLGLAGYDVYAAGYGFSWIFVLAASGTVALVYRGSRVSWVLIAAIAAFNLKLLPHSQNFIDYLIDGPLFLVSLGAVFFMLIRKRK
jgi:hypothetical protein